MQQIIYTIFMWIEQKRNSNRWLAALSTKIEPLLKIPALTLFIKNLGKLFLYKWAATFFLFLAGIIAARALGPADFGIIGLVGNAANFLILPMIMGINSAMYKFLPGCRPSKVKIFISTALWGNVITTIFFSVLFFLGYEWIGGALKISRFVWTLSLIFTIVLNFVNLSESFLRGQEQYSLIGKTKLISSVAFLFLIGLVLLGFRQFSLEAYYYCFFSGQLIFILIALGKSCTNFGGFSLKAGKKIFQYGVIIMFHMLANAIIFSSDLFILNYFSPGDDVGIYSVYQGTVKNTFVIMFYEIFSVVFLPTIAQMDRVSVYYKIKKIVLPILSLVTLASLGLISFTILLYGKEYPLNPYYALLVSLSIGFYVLFQLYNSIFTMEGKKSALTCLIPFAIVLPVFIINQVLFTKHWGITGAMTSVLITNILLFFTLHFLIKKSLVTKHGSDYAGT